MPKDITTGYATWLASGSLTQAWCLKITRTDSVVIAATSHDTDLVVDGITYLAVAGGTEADVASTNSLAPDNSEERAILNLDSITEDDMHSGLYDYAAISLFVVDYTDPSIGKMSERDGFLGQITTERSEFIAELRGLAELLKLTLGGLCLPLCPYNLGDLPFPAPGYRGRCTKDLTSFTVTGTLTGVSADQLTLFDPARTEPGPGAGIAITAISNANPCVITLASPIGVPDGSAVVLSGIVGPALLNATETVRNPSGNSFSIDVDTSDTSAYPPYVGSGGVATPVGADSGYFDYGLFTVNSGVNAGRSKEVKAYVPGQWTLQEPFWLPLLGTETYTMTAGCNKTPFACRIKFDNLVNNGSYPFVPGQDKILQVASNASPQPSGKN
jgi:hypothetical protein